MFCKRFAFLFAAHLGISMSQAGDALTTLAERSEWKQTGRYEEVERLCRGFEKKYPKAIDCFDFGKTPEGRKLWALSIFEGKRQGQKPVVLIQGGIHAGEIDGKDAGFLALKEILAGRHPDIRFDGFTWIFVPVFNADGHERFGPNHRPNQNGPESTGWRTTSQNLNLNRDYMKADAPEMLAMLGLLNRWDPVLYVDLHVTDGAQFQHDIAYIFEPSDPLQGSLSSIANSIRDRLMADVSKKGHLPLDFYPWFKDENNPASGVESGEVPPRFAHGYWRVRNRIGLLVESHSWKPYGHRVKATQQTILSLLRQATQSAAGWIEKARHEDRVWKTMPPESVTLKYEIGPKSRTIDFKGYAYERKPSEVSGGTRVTYFPDRPQIWKIPFFDTMVPQIRAKVPGRGYLIPAPQASSIESRLAAHGIEFSRYEAKGPVSAQVYRIRKTTHAKATLEGRLRVEVAGEWGVEQVRVGRGALFVPIRQSRGPLAMGFLEPEAPDSFLSWGFFNAYLEQKEYLEPYLAEAFAEQTLEADAGLAGQFHKQLASDADFKKDPKQRLDFFYRRHPAWDKQLGVYPIYRLD